jgi:protein-S-isoprenylcysteine O-methyltransferase
MVGSTLLVVILLFPISEVALAVFKRANRRAAAVDDRGSLRLIWIVIGASVCAAIGLEWVSAAAIQVPGRILHPVALGLLLLGLAIRWVSILTLGRFFTVNVSVQHDHELVEAGPYRYVRHPSYSGLLLAFVGLGLNAGNWLSLGAVVIPITLAVLWRIRIEERALVEALGTPYVQYSARTKRLVPGLD